MVKTADPINKLTVQELKKFIKMYKKEKNLQGMKKAELREHLKHLIGNGKIKPKHKHEVREGGGLWDYVKTGYNKVKDIITKPFVYGSHSYSFLPSTQKMLNKYGDIKIKEIKACRTPVTKVLQKIINLISLGKFKQGIDKTPYDDVYHLYLQITLDNNKVLVVEKNDNINISDKITHKPNTEIIDVPMNGKSLTVNEMLATCLNTIGQDDFFLYDGLRGRNCQNFVVNCLKSSGLGNQSNYDWILQDLTEVNKALDESNLGHSTRTIVTGVTTLGSNVARLKEKIGLGKNKEDTKIYYLKQFILHLDPTADVDGKSKEELLKLVNDMRHLNGSGLMDIVNDLLGKLLFKGTKSAYNNAVKEYQKHEPARQNKAIEQKHKQDEAHKKADTRKGGNGASRTIVTRNGKKINPYTDKPFASVEEYQEFFKKRQDDSKKEQKAFKERNEQLRNDATKAYREYYEKLVDYLYKFGYRGRQGTELGKENSQWAENFIRLYCKDHDVSFDFDKRNKEFRFFRTPKQELKYQFLKQYGYNENFQTPREFEIDMFKQNKVILNYNPDVPPNDRYSWKKTTKGMIDTISEVPFLEKGLDLVLSKIGSEIGIGDNMPKTREITTAIDNNAFGTRTNEQIDNALNATRQDNLYRNAAVSAYNTGEQGQSYSRGRGKTSAILFTGLSMKKSGKK